MEPLKAVFLAERDDTGLAVVPGVPSHGIHPPTHSARPLRIDLELGGRKHSHLVHLVSPTNLEAGSKLVYAQALVISSLSLSSSYFFSETLSMRISVIFSLSRRSLR